MLQQPVIDLIQLKLGEIQSYTSQFSGKNVSRIELDIVRKKISEVYDLLYTLDSQNEEIASDIDDIISMQDVEKTESEELFQETQSLDFVEDEKEELPPEEPEQKTEKKQVVAEKVQVQKEEIVEKPAADNDTESIENETILTSEPKKTEHSEIKVEKTVISPEKDLSQKLGKTPVSNIASAIGINERYQFTKELFANDVQLYTEAIQKLNELSSFEQACSLLKKQFSLDFEHELSQRFLNIVERRYL
ncbi:MAG: hypothetical protein PF481_06045 [Bacteroidales bacterium]|jgi:hypothetical protein|nr:hypothetical protein [Bacteroidales bacterium]